MEDAAHFHYDITEIGPLALELMAQQEEEEEEEEEEGEEEEGEKEEGEEEKEKEVAAERRMPARVRVRVRSGARQQRGGLFSVSVSSRGRSWVVRRSREDFVFLDRQLHSCVYDRRMSQLPQLPQLQAKLPQPAPQEEDAERETQKVRHTKKISLLRNRTHFQTTL